MVLLSAMRSAFGSAAGADWSPPCIGTSSGITGGVPFVCRDGRPCVFRLGQLSACVSIYVPLSLSLGWRGLTVAGIPRSRLSCVTRHGDRHRITTAISDGSDYFRPRLRPFRPLRLAILRPPFFFPESRTTALACLMALASLAPRLSALSATCCH